MSTATTAKLKAKLTGSNWIYVFITDPELSSILKGQHHIPCLAHVIQLGVNALLRKLRVEAPNDEVLYNWENGEEACQAHHGITRRVEKVGYFTARGKTPSHNRKLYSALGHQ
jgi:hypothetical protein